MDSPILFQIAIGLIPNVGGHIARKLINYAGDVEEVFKLNKKKLLSIPDIGEKTCDIILSENYIEKAKVELEKLHKNNIKFTFYTEEIFPQRLKKIYDSPLALYYKGNFNFNCERVISIVGTRQATDYGKKVTEQIVEYFQGSSTYVYSGLAYGIDILAHKAAVKFKVPTVGVLANGLDIVYPAIHKSIAEQMLQNGGLISENPIGTKPDKGRFPARNRIIAGMADVLIVVEAAEKGGALITANIANDYNKDVYAVPGPLNAPYSAGCNLLIKDHKATIFTSIESLIQDLDWQKSSKEKIVKITEIDYSKFDKDTVVVIKALLEKPLHIDEICWSSSMNMNRISSILLNLEMDDMIEVLPGKLFKLKL